MATYLDRIIAQRTPTPLPAAPAPDLVLTVDGVSTVMAHALAGPAYVAAIGAGKVASLRPVGAVVVAPSLPSTPLAVAIAAPECDDTACDLDRWSDVDELPADETARDRVLRQEADAVAAGFTLAPLLYEPGQRVIDVGDENFAAMRRELAALPSIDVAAAQFREVIASERREDQRHDARELRVSDTDGYTLTVGPKLASNAFGQLAALCKFGRGAMYLEEDCGPTLRAHNVNTHLMALDKARPVVLRTRIENGRRVAYAAVTPTYQAVDADKILDGVAAAGVLDQTRVELTYNGARMRASALDMPDTVVDLACGDVFRAGVRISTDDTGRGRIRVSAVLFRNRCLNLIIVDEAEVETMSRVHRGSLPVAEVVAEVVAAVEAARAKVAPFLDSWRNARAYKIARPREALADLVADRGLVLTGMRSAAQRGQLVGAIQAAFDVEPGDSAADLANAITRAAHERTDLFSLDLREELEKQAGALILLPGQLLSSYRVAA